MDAERERIIEQAFGDGDRRPERMALVDSGPRMPIQSAALRDGVPAERILRFRTAQEIAAETPEEIVWYAKPWVAAGAITEVGGKVKAAGKTTWLLAMSGAMLDGRSFMGGLTTRTPVVFLTEQSPSTFRVALRRARLLDRNDLIALYWRETAGRPWADVVAATVAECHRRGAHVLMVDTLGQFAGLQGDAENDAGAALAAMAPLQRAAADGLAVVVSRHDRKSGGEVGDSGRGSSAFAGAVDVVLSIRRLEGQGHDTAREIHSLSRFDETPPRLVIELLNGDFVSLGTTEDVEKQRAQAKILAALPHDEGAALTQDDLFKAAAIKRTTGQEVLAELVREQRVSRSGEGKRGNPYRYALFNAGKP